MMRIKRLYENYVYREKRNIPCNFCGEIMLPCTYNRHLNGNHDRNIAKQKRCIWCWKKLSQIDMQFNVHRLRCAKQYVISKHVPARNDEIVAAVNVEDLNVEDLNSQPAVVVVNDEDEEMVTVYVEDDSLTLAAVANLIATSSPQMTQVERDEESAAAATDVKMIAISSPQSLVNLCEGIVNRYDLVAVSENKWIYNCKICHHWYTNERFRVQFRPPQVSPLAFEDVKRSNSLTYLDDMKPKVLKTRNCSRQAAEKNKIYNNRAELMSKYVNMSEIPFDDICGIESMWLQMYVYGKYKWFHFSIRLLLWEKFVEIAENNCNMFLVLPYWCLCNGGKADRLEYHHRHSIVYVRDEDEKAFRKLMDNIKFENRKSSMLNSSGKRMYSKFLRPIRDAKHMMNTLRYISSSRSMCCEMNGGGGRLPYRGIQGEERRCHYYIGKHMNPHCLLGMALCIPDGFQIVTEILRTTADIENPECATKSKTGLWYIPYTEIFSKNLLDHELPLSRDILMWEINNEIRNCLLVNDEKRYYIRRPASSAKVYASRVAKHKYLVSVRGFVNNCTYRMNRLHARVLNKMEKINVKCRDLKTKCRGLKSECRNLKSEIADLTQKLNESSGLQNEILELKLKLNEETNKCRLKDVEITTFKQLADERTERVVLLEQYLREKVYSVDKQIEFERLKIKIDVLETIDKKKIDVNHSSTVNINQN